jgi:hypothetical protein
MVLWVPAPASLPLGTYPIVVHPLGILGVSHDARHVQATIYLKFVANNAHNRDVLTRPLAFFQNFVPVDLAVVDFDADRTREIFFGLP